MDGMGSEAGKGDGDGVRGEDGDDGSGMKTMARARGRR